MILVRNIKQHVSQITSDFVCAGIKELEQLVFQQSSELDIFRNKVGFLTSKYIY